MPNARYRISTMFCHANPEIKERQKSNMFAQKSGFKDLLAIQLACWM